MANQPGIVVASKIWNIVLVINVALLIDSSERKEYE